RGADRAASGRPGPGAGGGGESHQRGVLLPKGRRPEPGREPVPGGHGRPAPADHAPGRRGDARRLPGRAEPQRPERLVPTTAPGVGREVTVSCHFTPDPISLLIPAGDGGGVVGGCRNMVTG